MSLSSCIASFFLSMNCFGWYNGSKLLETDDVTNKDLCLVCGLYLFFMSPIMLFWELKYGYYRSIKTIPLRGLLYLGLSIFPLLTWVSALAGILWINTAIFSILAWKKQETYEEKKQRSGKYSDFLNHEKEDFKQWLLNILHLIIIKQK